MFSKSYALSVSDIREEVSKIKLKSNGNPADLLEAIADIDNQKRKIQGDSITEIKLCSKVIMTAPKK